MSRTYEEAFNLAVDTANRLQVDVGIAKDDFGGYSYFLLPWPENRVGHELRCQVVRPGTPKTATQEVNK